MRHRFKSHGSQKYVNSGAKTLFLPEFGVYQQLRSGVAVLNCKSCVCVCAPGS